LPRKEWQKKGPLSWGGVVKREERREFDSGEKRKKGRRLPPLGERRGGGKKGAPCSYTLGEKGEGVSLLMGREKGKGKGREPISIRKKDVLLLGIVGRSKYFPERKGRRRGGGMIFDHSEEEKEKERELEKGKGKSCKFRSKGEKKTHRKRGDVGKRGGKVNPRNYEEKEGGSFWKKKEKKGHYRGREGSAVRPREREEEDSATVLSEEEGGRRRRVLSRERGKGVSRHFPKGGNQGKERRKGSQNYYRRRREG